MARLISDGECECIALSIAACQRDALRLVFDDVDRLIKRDWHTVKCPNGNVDGARFRLPRLIIGHRVGERISAAEASIRCVG